MKLKLVNSLFLFTFFISEKMYTQPIPTWKFLNKNKKSLFDSGLNWDNLSSIQSIRKKSKFYKYSSLSLDNSLGFFSDFENFSLLFNGNIFFNNYYFFFETEFSRFNSNNHLIGINNFQSFELKSSGMGYQNNWVTLQIGKGYEHWGSGNHIELALSEKGNPYDYLMLSSNYGNIRVNYIHGFLETTFNPNTNRYINARGIEWTNKKSLIISLTEAIIYSGQNRGFEIGYFNPIGSHLEIELNNRLTTLNSNSANAVWQLHIDYLFKKHHRFSLNYLLDEFVLDQNIEIGKEHGKAFSGKYVFSSKLKSKYIMNLFLSGIYVGTPTFRHGNGQNNFVNDNLPLGWEYGSDGLEIALGVCILNRDNSIFELSLGILSNGDESILNNSYSQYSDYIKGKFPSGNIYSRSYLKNNLSFKWNKYLILISGVELIIKSNSDKLLRYSTGFEINY